MNRNMKVTDFIEKFKDIIDAEGKTNKDITVGTAVRIIAQIFDIYENSK